MTQQEFITLNSRLTLKKDTLTEQKLNYNEEEIRLPFLAFIGLMAISGITVYQIVEEQKYHHLIRFILIAYFLYPFLKWSYQTLFIKTWHSTIKLSRIKKVQMVPLENGIETKVILHLLSGRQKWYVFRNKENELKAFVAAVSPLEKELVPTA